jgi:hypothetical protein
LGDGHISHIPGVKPYEHAPVLLCIAAAGIKAARICRGLVDRRQH